MCCRNKLCAGHDVWQETSQVNGLKVKLPMVLYMDNKGGVNIFNNWSIAGNTRTVAVWFAYVRELKEAGILEIKGLASFCV